MRSSELLSVAKLDDDVRPLTADDTPSDANSAMLDPADARRLWRVSDGLLFWPQRDWSTYVHPVSRQPINCRARRLETSFALAAIGAPDAAPISIFSTRASANRTSSGASGMRSWLSQAPWSWSTRRLGSRSVRSCQAVNAGLSVSSTHWRNVVGVVFSGVRTTALSRPLSFATAMSTIPSAIASE